jgi:hypothetical protein
MDPVAQRAKRCKRPAQCSTILLSQIEFIEK